MKRFAFIVLTLLALSGPVNAANYYFDLASGNDTTGDGSSGNPWKTIDKCTTSRTAGDECRGAITAITALSGTLTFTNGSTTVNTSEDLTAVVAANDLIGKNSGLEGWWKVASLTSSAITLSYQYWGLSGSGSAVTGYKITPVVASEEYDVNSSGSSGGYLNISGGWDLSTQSQDGITAFSSSYTFGIDLNGKNWIEISKFVISQLTSGFNLSGATHHAYLHDIWICDGEYLYSNASYQITINNFVCTGGPASGLKFDTLYNSEIMNCYLFSTGTGTTDFGLYNKACAVFFDNLRIYNGYSGSVFFHQEAYFNFFKNGIFSKTRNGPIVTYGGSENRLFNITIDNGSSYNFNFANAGSQSNLFVIESDITNGASGNITYGTSYKTVLQPFVTISKTGQNSISTFSAGTIEHDSSVDCRSGKCIKFTPTSAGVPLVSRVGNVKIPSAGTDLTLNLYLKKDAGFNGVVIFLPVRNGCWISRSEKTPTTTYVKESIVIGTAELIADEYMDLYAIVSGTAGSIWVDDFSAEQ